MSKDSKPDNSGSIPNDGGINIIQLSSVLDIINGLLCVHDKRGQIIYMNHRMKEWLGYLEEIPNDFYFWDLTPENHRIRVQNYVEQGEWIDEIPVLAQNGRQFVVEARSSNLHENGQLGGCIVLLEDITDRKKSEEEMLVSKNLLNDIIESSPDAMLVIDKSGRVLYWNRAMTKLTGYPAKLMVGKGNYEHSLAFYKVRRPLLIDIVLHPELEELAPMYAGFKKQGDVLIGDTKIIYLKAGDHANWARAAPLYNSQGEVIGAIETMHDITDRYKAEQEIRDSQRLLKDIIESLPDATLVIDKEGKILHWNRAMVEMTGYPAKDMVGKGNREYSLPIYNGVRRPMLVDMIIHPEQDIDFMFDNLRRKGAVLITDSNVSYLKGQERIIWAHAVPLYNSQGEVVGAIETIRDVTELKRAEEELKESHEQLEALFIGTVNALSTTTEKRDQYTAGHQHRVAGLACAIAREMELSKDIINNISIAGTLHDIGKLYVPLDILSQTSKLTDIQRLFVMTHPAAGYDIVKSIPFEGPVAQIIQQHHERLDGSGYPLGLKGNEILLEARILAVADTVEAMASHRPYRLALGIDKALEEIQQNSGKLYDEIVVNACVKVFQEHKYELNVIV